MGKGAESGYFSINPGSPGKQKSADQAVCFSRKRYGNMKDSLIRELFFYIL
jgi:hypothetical protein